MTDQLNRTTSQINYGKRDRLNREIGTFVATWEVNPATDQWADKRAFEAGKLYGLFTQATRDNVKYGAIQSRSFYATTDERAKELQRRIKASEKRAALKEGK